MSEIVVVTEGEGVDEAPRSVIADLNDDLARTPAWSAGAGGTLDTVYDESDDA